jgi:DNA-binding HxlR family transcriptional regulator
MTGLRSYGDPCGIARALDVVGERWALLIVRELIHGPKRFSDLRTALGASPNVLTQRLGELEDFEVVQRRKTGGALYELTDWGRELRPILLQLGRWGARSRHVPRGQLGMDSLLLALESTFVPENAGALDAVYELRLDDERFSVEVRDGTLAIQRGSARAPDVVIETEPATLRGLVFGDQKPSDSPAKISGDARLGRVFFRLFARP